MAAIEPTLSFPPNAPFYLTSILHGLQWRLTGPPRAPPELQTLYFPYPMLHVTLPNPHPTSPTPPATLDTPLQNRLVSTVPLTTRPTPSSAFTGRQLVQFLTTKSYYATPHTPS